MANRFQTVPSKRVGRSALAAETKSTSLRSEVGQSRVAWLWLAFLLGAAIRIYLIVGTESGQYDVPVWEKHAKSVHDLGLARYYEQERDFNYSPATGLLISWLWSLRR